MSSADTTTLKGFLDSPKRPDKTMGFHQLQGFLFAIACSPETISPSEWIPMIGSVESDSDRLVDREYRVKSLPLLRETVQFQVPGRSSFH